MNLDPNLLLSLAVEVLSKLLGILDNLSVRLEADRDGLHHLLASWLNLYAFENMNWEKKSQVMLAMCI
jgi:hypothetical protein